ncbi:PREDICTED: uncharacterized protein LOC105568701 [Vollenhovia emeryi]|uniref:uncharacterized protein LOC105568701 n=1 Tax=Vollenhovia emeryi TaxID=411798 RepID=UPI0005F36A88|nr:PREDICTED: uncharacterized protein LOC105568701 [Vollenhovia emeryi]
MSNIIDNKTYQDDAIVHTKYTNEYLLKADMPARRTPKVEALVVNAIRRLQDVQGSTSREISNYISQEYNVPIEETRQQVQFALRRGLSYGILKCSKGGYYSCNRDYLGQFSLENGMGDGVMEPCPLQPWRKRGIERWRRKMKRRKREARERSRKRREEENVEEEDEAEVEEEEEEEEKA